MLNKFEKVAPRGTLVSVLALAVGLGATAASAQTPNCALVAGALPAGCAHDNAGLVVSRPGPTTAGHSSAGDLGAAGFSISIDGGATTERQHVAGAIAATDRLRQVDRSLSQMGLRVTVDRLGAQPVLNVATMDLRRSYQAGDRITFRSSTNYPAWIDRAEIIVVDPAAPHRPVAVLQTAPNGTVDWTMPADGPERMAFILRAYDAQGRRDETVALPLVRSDGSLAEADLTEPAIAAGEGEDRTARRGIPVTGAVVTVSGNDMPARGGLRLMGEQIQPDLRRNFVIQRILPPGTHDVTISAGAESQTQTVTIPQRDIFATGIAEVTLGRDLGNDETYRFGRVAGFVDGVFANGTRLRASVDTRDDELRDLFRDVTRRHPDQVLRQIEDRDVWVTTGDDSRTENLAPTSGKLFLRLERDNSHIMWGDFRPESDLSRVVRTDRTLYGASGRWESDAVTPDGEARAALSGYAAQVDRLTQRDIFRGTGGSSYFLSRRDIESGTETLIVEVRDPLSGRIVSSSRLIEGRDYRIDYVQGVVILNAPLSPSAGGPGLIADRPLGDYNVNLVAQYDYVPAAGAALADTFGGRAEAWITPQLRVGASGARETSGLADNTLVGADLLLRRHDGTYLSVDIAQSEGPGLNARPSLTGGLDLDSDEVAAGMRGRQALGVRVEGRQDLADYGGKGYVLGWYEDREAGFWSPDYNAAEDQSSYGIDGSVGVGRMTLTFGAEEARQNADRSGQKARVGVETALGSDLTLAVELAHLERRNLAATAPEGDNGSRTDLGARLTWDAAEDASYWIFGQASLHNSGDVASDSRIGVGAEVDLTDAMALSAQVSTGEQGFAGTADLSYRPTAASTYRLGLREDATQAADLFGTGRRGLTFGADRQINDAWAVTTETVMGGLRDHRSMLSTYGVTYTPSDARTYSVGLLSGQTREADGTNVTRDGLSFGLDHNYGEDLNYRLRTEYREDRSDNPARFTRRESWLVSGEITYKTSDDWQFVGGLDLVLSSGEDVSLRDGRYVEGRLGYAYRPVDNDRLNALLGYTFLDDQPGADQVNIDGDVNGPRQQSHILNAALSYDLDARWTLGLKYGLRQREQTDRISGDSFESLSHLGVARVDYRIVQKWDVMGEFRAFHSDNAETTDYAALLGVYREISPNARIGVGYHWGGVSDDLRTIDPEKEGVFLNIIGKF